MINQCQTILQSKSRTDSIMHIDCSPNFTKEKAQCVWGNALILGIALERELFASVLRTRPFFDGIRIRLFKTSGSD